MSLLNAKQLQFIESNEKHIRLLAPAGSGKTRSLLERALWLVHNSPTLPKILILVFTKAAAQELKSRVNTDPHFEKLRARVTISTLNSWGNKRIQNILDNRNFLTSDFQLRDFILNGMRSEWLNDEALVKALQESRRKQRNAKTVVEGFDKLQDLGFHPDKTKTEEINAHIEWLKSVKLFDHLMHLESDIKNAGILGKKAEISRFIRFWSKCVSASKISGYYRYNDQKFLPWLDFEQKLAEGKRATGGAAYSHIFIDEAQDLSALDANLIRTLRAYHDASLTIAGDDDQAIFEWRAASVDFILHPDQTFGVPFATYVLDENYRSPQNIVRMAKDLIRHNTLRVDKDTIANRSDSASIRVLESETPAQRSTATLRYIESAIEADPEVRIALLSRKRAHLLPLQILCAEREIPFLAAEDLSILLSESFENLRNMVGHISLLQLPESVRRKLGTSAAYDSVVLELVDRIQRYPLSKADSAALRTHLRPAAKKSIDECVELLSQYTGQLGQAANGSSERALELAEIVRAFLNALTVADAIRVIESSFEGMQTDFIRREEDVFHTDPPFEQLSEFATRYGDDFDAFLEALDQAKEAQRESQSYFSRSEDDEQEKVAPYNVSFMTALRAKGREFDSVVILECNDGFWPSKFASSPHQLEAERRLFYVATTRTQKELVFVTSTDRSECSPYLAEFLGENAVVDMLRTNLSDAAE